MDKDKLRKAMIEAMPDSISGDIKIDIANIMMKVMDAVDGKSTMGTMIALDILKDMYEQNLTETIKGKFGDGSEIHKMVVSASLMAKDDSGTVH